MLTEYNGIRIDPNLSGLKVYKVSPDSCLFSNGWLWAACGKDDVLYFGKSISEALANTRGNSPENMLRNLGVDFETRTTGSVYGIPAEYTLTSSFIDKPIVGEDRDKLLSELLKKVANKTSTVVSTTCKPFGAIKKCLENQLRELAKKSGCIIYNVFFDGVYYTIQLAEKRGSPGETYLFYHKDIVDKDLDKALMGAIEEVKAVIEEDEFEKHLNTASDTVSQWPAWKQKLLGGTASTETPVEEKKLSNVLRAIIVYREGFVEAQLLDIDIAATGKDIPELLKKISYTIELRYDVAKILGETPFLSTVPKEFEEKWKEDSSVFVGTLELHDNHSKKPEIVLYDLHATFVNKPKVSPSSVKETRRSWDSYFMEIAESISTRSIDPVTKHGTVIVDKDKNIVATGCNGPIAGINDSKVPLTRPEKYFHLIHSEINAILRARRDISGMTVYITGEPCVRCLLILAQAGISKIVHGDRKSNCIDEFDQTQKQLILDLMKEAGKPIEIIQYSSERES